MSLWARGRDLEQVGRFVPPRGRALAALVLLLVATLAAAEDAKLSDAQRVAILRGFLAERPFAHRAFPRDKIRFRIEGDKITPSEAETKQLIDHYGTAAKPGERVQITAVRFEHGGILFEINGGTKQHTKWTDHVNVGVNGADPRGPQNEADNAYSNLNGCSILLAIKDGAAALTVDRIKEMLAPILDFQSMNVAAAYQKILPPVLAQAVKEHRALVGMDKDLVSYALGRPQHRLRESLDGKDYEEWIYGDPPQDVKFIRFLDDKVVRIEEMKVSGEKVVRTEDEVGDLGGVLNASAANKTQPEAMSAATEPGAPPTLLRPGEKAANADDGTRGAKRDSNSKPDASAPIWLY